MKNVLTHAFIVIFYSDSLSESEKKALSFHQKAYELQDSVFSVVFLSVRFDGIKGDLCGQKMYCYLG